jgi:hypothetical protein
MTPLQATKWSSFGGVDYQPTLRVSDQHENQCENSEVKKMMFLNKLLDKN